MSNFKRIDITGWELLSERPYSFNYYSPDGRWLLKVYRDMQATTIEGLLAEQARSQRVAALGIPTPEVGDIVETSQGYGILFQRVHHKISLARAAAADPAHAPEFARKFAQCARTLHAAPCDTQAFESRKSFFKRAARASVFIAEDEREAACRFIDALEDAETCLHGDLTMGNVIIGDEGMFFIDLGMFCWGTPKFDVGQWRNLATVALPGVLQSILHFTPELMQTCWNEFALEYFGADCASRRKEIDDALEPYIALVPVMVEAIAGPEERCRAEIDRYLRPLLHNA